MSITKREFQDRVVFLHELAKRSLAELQLVAEIAEPSYLQVGEHDPVLAQLLKDVDSSAIAPLQKLKSYIESKLES